MIWWLDGDTMMVIDGDMMIYIRIGEVLGPEIDYTRW